MPCLLNAYMQIQFRRALAATIFMSMIVSTACATETDMVKVFDIGNLLCLSPRYAAGDTSYGGFCSDISDLLQRAKNNKFTHVTGYVRVIYNWDEYATLPISQNYFAEAAQVADQYGFGLIPKVGASDRNFWEYGWQDFFGYSVAMTQGTTPVTANPNEANLVETEQNKYSLSSPTVPSTIFDEKYQSLLERLRTEFDAVKSTLSAKHRSIDYFNVSFDEAAAMPEVSGGSVLMLGYSKIAGFGSNADRDFISANGNNALAFRKALAKGIWHRVNQVVTYFNPAKGVMLFGNSFDPQLAGMINQNTYLNGVTTQLSPGNGDDVLDFPGLSTAEKDSVKSQLVVLPWYYGSSGSDYKADFDIQKSYDYFISKGVRVGGFNAIVDSWECGTLAADPGRDSYKRGVEQFKMAAEAGRRIKSPLFVGATAAFYGKNCDSTPTYRFPYWKFDHTQYDQKAMFEGLELITKYLY
jgi:hypothetical protein